jgi:hypothetical protein
MSVEDKIHIVNRYGEVIFPQGIVRGKRPYVELTDRKGGIIAFATLDASGWKRIPGYATPAQIAAAPREPQQVGHTTEGDWPEGKNTASGIIPAALGNTASERLAATLTEPQQVGRTTEGDRLQGKNIASPGIIPAALGNTASKRLAAALTEPQQVGRTTEGDRLQGKSDASPSGIIPAAPGNTASERLDSLITLKILGSTKDAFDRSARKVGVSTGALARWLIESFLAGSKMSLVSSSAVVAMPMAIPLHKSPDRRRVGRISTGRSEIGRPGSRLSKCNRN